MEVKLCLAILLSCLPQAWTSFNCTFQEGFCGWEQSTEDSANWFRNQGRSSGGSTGPIYDKTFGDLNGYYIYYEATGGYEGKNAVLISPVVLYSWEQQGNTWCCTFWYNMYGINMGTLNVSRVPASGALCQGEVLFTLSGQQTNQYTWMEAEICTNVTSSFRIAIEAIRGNGYRSDIAVDDVQSQAPEAAIELLDSGDNYISSGGLSQVLEGEPHRFTCTVPDMNAAVSLSWTLGGLDIASNCSSYITDDDGFTTSSSTAIISASATDHRQVLQCLASTETSLPFASSSATLDVEVPPKAYSMGMYVSGQSTSGVSSVDVDGGAVQTFRCEVQDTRPAATIQWFLNDVLQRTRNPTTGTGDRLVDTTDTWTFTATVANHDQLVKCVASIAESPHPLPYVMVRLEVTGPPEIYVMTSSTSMMEHEPVSLTCQGYLGYPDDWSLVWSQDDTPLLGRTTTSSALGSRFMFTSTLAFTPKKADNGSMISCSAQRSSWTGSSAVGFLGPISVKYPPEFSSSAWSPSGPVAEGNDVVMSCTADANPKPPDFITWEKVGSTDSLPSVYSDGTSTLTLRSISREQAGPYRCRGSNGVPPVVYSSPIDVIVHYRPYFSEPAATPHGPVGEGDDVVLSCTADANPQPPDFITWEKVGSTDSLPSVYSDGTSTLTLRSISREQAGPYRCRGNNGVPPVVYSTSVDVIVRYRPSFSEPSAIPSDPVEEGGEVVLSCTADANPNPPGFITWERVGSTDSLPSVYSDGTSILTLSNISREQAGPYRCRGNNGVPPVVYSSQIDVLVRYRPYFTEPASTPPCPVEEGDDVVLSCTADANPKPPDFITWEKVGSTDSLPSVYSDGTSTLTLSKIRREQAGPYRCRGNNGVPPVVYSSQIDVLVRSVASSEVPFFAAIGTLGLMLVISVILNVVGLRFYRRTKSTAPKVMQQNPPKIIDGTDNPVRVVDDAEAYEAVGIEMQTVQSDKKGTVVSTYDQVPECHASFSRNQTVQSDKKDTVVSTYDQVPECHASFSRNQLTVIRELGQGAFGKVLLANARDIEKRGAVTQVAIKTVKDGGGPKERENLIRDLYSMKSTSSHANVVRLLGHCISEEPVYVIVEYLSKGNLKEILTECQSNAEQLYDNVRSHPSTSLSPRDMLSFARDVAAGMAFLSSRKCLHKDLAARSVLVGQDMVCKVSDFGFASDVMRLRAHQRKCQERVPLRWMALESILDDVYTTESDVWSFGVLLWEILTFGARPYPKMSAKMMIARLKNEYRMPRPSHCGSELYHVMSSCWAKNPAGRLPFHQISERMEEYLGKADEVLSLEMYQGHLYEVTIPSSPDEKV